MDTLWTKPKVKVNHVLVATLLVLMLCICARSLLGNNEAAAPELGPNLYRSLASEYREAYCHKRMQTVP